MLNIVLMEKFKLRQPMNKEELKNNLKSITDEFVGKKNSEETRQQVQDKLREYLEPIVANEINKKLSVELFQLQFEMIAAVVSERIAQTVALRRGKGNVSHFFSLKSGQCGQQ